MLINENQLDVWAKQGSVSQSKSTYDTVRSVLESVNAPYNTKSYSIFLQGSYGNDTNIYADSDVDIVIKLDSTYYHNANELPSEQREIYELNTQPATYSYDSFKADVIAQLAKSFGSAVKPGKKAIFIEGNGSRRNADVVVATEYRKYTRYQGPYNSNYTEGICFWSEDMDFIINYPKKHSENCTAKHQGTGGYFKPMVRILKNMRNRMIDEKYLAEGLAPSYFLEGMMYNVPANKFGRNYFDTFTNSINWLIESDKSQLVCANEQYYLVNPSSPVTWREEKLNEYLGAVVKYWNMHT